MAIYIENQYFVAGAYYFLSIGENSIHLEACERFQKMTFRNRCVISGSNGLIHLTVPVVHGRENKRPIREVKIDYSQAWQKQHWRAIESSYRKSPFFDFHCDSIKALIFEKHDLLFDKNFAIMKWVNQALHIQQQLLFTTEYKAQYTSPGDLDLRNYWLPKNFQKQSLPEAPHYIQVFEDRFGFLPNLSVLDLLFCKGGL